MLSQVLAVCRLPADQPVPEWALAGSFFSVTRTSDELSIACEDGRVPEGIRAEHGWTGLKLEGPFPFSMTGVLASFLEPLAAAGISIFAVSTFDTDCVLVKSEMLSRAVEALQACGHRRV